MSLAKIEEIDKISKRKNSGDRNYVKFLKKSVHKRERLKMKKDLEYEPEYRRFAGWEH